MRITSKEIIIKIDKECILFSPDISIPANRTNLQLDQMNFKSINDIYWLVQLIKYIEESKCWQVRVSDFTVRVTDNFKRQKTTKIIESVIFKDLDWMKLKPLLSYYSPEVPFNLASYQIPEEIPSLKIKSELETYFTPNSPNIVLLKIEFSVKFQNATFIKSFVTFKKHIKQIGIQVKFKIKNDHILEEFNNIKMWFAKRLNTKKFDVTATITLIDNHISEIKANSLQIDLITPSMVECVKYDRTVALTRQPKATNPDKSLYSIDDIFKLLDSEDRDSNIFGQSEIDIIKILSQTYHVRNFKQLEFLSLSNKNTKGAIHYTLNPHFGFLFLIEGNIKYHFVWELLQSHATYLWSTDKENTEIPILYEKIEGIINEILKNGRDPYKKTFAGNALKFGFTFHHLEHNDISLNLEEGFNKWKSKLEALLI